ncbi:MAG: cyclohexanecarboxylate-CoA ligase [Alphaproteobacteria bacterium]|nr:cyclohexanecarboxylate-CoA ligase [Alphaproteobacteria bacterium]
MTAAATGLITDRLAGIAARDPRRELVVDAHYGRLTYAQVAEQVERLAAALLAHDLGRGDVVILQLPNWAPFIVLHLALTRIGAVTATIPLVYRERELRALLAQTRAKALVVPARFRDFDYGAMAEWLRAEAPGLAHVILVGGGEAVARAGCLSYEDLLARSWPAGDDPGALAKLAPGSDDLTALGFTSGTTGDLKGAMWSSRILAATNAGFIARYGLNEGDRIFGCSPLGHSVGFTHAVRMTLTIGGSIVLLERWEPAAALAMIERERPTFMAAATPFLLDLVYHPDLARRGALQSVRLFLCGGASIPEKLVRDARAAMPATFTSPLWGMTECGGVTTCPFDCPEEKLYTTDGLPCGGMELKVVDAGGDTVAPGADGELMAKGPMVTMGYYRQPELTAKSYQADGWFRTGDQARMDGDGYVKITGRIKDLIIRGGVNISPVEVEDVLFAHPAVANVAVVGMPDPRLGERVCAYVITKPGAALGLAEVQRWMHDAGVAKQKWPERVEVVQALPMTPSGKIQKFRLRAMVAETLQQGRRA